MKKDYAIARMEVARRALAEAETAPEIKRVMDLAAAAELYARRQGLGDEVVLRGHRLRVDAQKKLGDVLRMQENRGRPKKPAPDRFNLKALGLTEEASIAAQLVSEEARVDPSKFEDYRENRLPLKALKRARLERRREAKRKANAEIVSKAVKADEIKGRFSCLLVDPPWDWGDEGDVNQLGRAKPDYATLGIGEIEKLPVGELADKDAHLYLWITNRSLPKGFGLLEAWGFRYVTMLTWPKPSFGMGNYFRGQTEHILFGVKGSLGLRRKDASTLLPEWKRGSGGHSSKPMEIYQFIESCSPGPYLEMFSRGERKNWVMWGESK